MTIGEKIKFYREQLVLTQNELAKATSIHPVSIRKYETNKTIPRHAQIEKIARVLNISPTTLTGREAFILETVGDYMTLLNILIDSKFLTIEGDLHEDGYLEQSSVFLKPSNGFAKKHLVNIEKADKFIREMESENLSEGNKDAENIQNKLMETAKQLKGIAKAQAESDSMIFDPSSKGLSVKMPPDLSKHRK